MYILFEKILRKKKNEIKYEIKILEYFSRRKEKKIHKDNFYYVNSPIRKKNKNNKNSKFNLNRIVSK